MPYIVTTSEPFDAAVHVHRPAFSRVAVATLDEARVAVLDIMNAAHESGAAPASSAMYDSGATLPVSGGSVGPLPDGTVIEVRPVLHAELARDAGLSRRDTPLMSDDAIVAAFNASR